MLDRAILHCGIWRYKIFQWAAIHLQTMHNKIGLLDKKSMTEKLYTSIDCTYKQRCWWQSNNHKCQQAHVRHFNDVATWNTGQILQHYCFDIIHPPKVVRWFHQIKTTGLNKTRPLKKQQPLYTIRIVPRPPGTAAQRERDAKYKCGRFRELRYSFKTLYSLQNRHW